MRRLVSRVDQLWREALKVPNVQCEASKLARPMCPVGRPGFRPGTLYCPKPFNSLSQAEGAKCSFQVGTANVPGGPDGLQSAGTKHVALTAQNCTFQFTFLKQMCHKIAPQLGPASGGLLMHTDQIKQGETAEILHFPLLTSLWLF